MSDLSRHTSEVLSDIAKQSTSNSDSLCAMLEKDTGLKFSQPHQHKDFDKAGFLVLDGDTQLAKGKLAQAAISFEKAIVMMKRSQLEPVAEPLAMLGIAKERQHDLPTAEKCLMSAVAATEKIKDGKIQIPDTGDTAFKLATLSRIERKLGKKEQAEQYLDCAIEILPYCHHELELLSGEHH